MSVFNLNLLKLGMSTEAECYKTSCEIDNVCQNKLECLSPFILCLHLILIFGNLQGMQKPRVITLFVKLPVYAKISLSVCRHLFYARIFNLKLWKLAMNTDA